MDGFSRILLEDHALQLPAEAQRYLGLVRDSAQQMGHLIEDLLAFSRLSRLPLNKQTVAPAEVVQKALAELGVGQEQRNVEITVGDLPACEADPALLKQVWVNLLANALKFTRSREAARIEVGFLPHSTPPGAAPGVGMDEVGTYFVRDNGVGFDMQYANKLFGVFQRLHRAEEYEGTGVGLAIVQRIVNRHGGRVWAEAEVDKGAAFYFTLEGGT
jgi:light-regulated signal transduction histidine kinase (bacteriophytochrome)